MSHNSGNEHRRDDNIGHSNVLGTCIIHGTGDEFDEFNAFVTKFPENPVTGIKFPSDVEIQGQSS